MKTVVVALCTLLAGACASESRPPDAPQWAPLVQDLAFQWSAESDVDLTGYPAVALRAYVESYELAGITEDQSAVYPGFIRSTLENVAREGDYLTQLAAIRPLPPILKRGPRKAIGTFNFHILEIKRLNGALEATVCRGSYAVYSPSKTNPDEFVSGAAFPENGEAPAVNNPGIDVLRIDLTDSDSAVRDAAPAEADTPQQGPERRPENDVFGPWLITARSAGYWGPVDDPRSRASPPDLVQRCAATMPQNAAERLAMITGLKEQPTPAVEAFPGWPEAAA